MQKTLMSKKLLLYYLVTFIPCKSRLCQKDEKAENEVLNFPLRMP